MRALVWIIVLLLWPLTANAQEMTAQEEQDSGYIASFISDNLSGVSRDVVISGFDGALSSRATIRVLTVADATGVWLRMEGLVLDWNRSALLRGRIEINALTADQITIFRAPVSESEDPSPEASAFALPELPVSVDITAVTATRITLGAPLLGEEISLSLNGTVALSGGEGSARLLADRIGEQAGRFEIDGAYSNITRVLALTADLTEAEDGIIARLLDLPGRPAVQLTLAGTASIDDYDADLTIATDEVERISGTLGLAALPDPDGGPVGRSFSLDIRGDVTPLLAPDYRDFFGTDVQLLVQGAQTADGAASLSALQITTASLALAGSADFTPEGWPARFALKGQIGSEGGEPVVLPISGAATTVQSMLLDVQFDAAADDGWTGDFTLANFTRPGLLIPDLTLSGGGTIVRAMGATPGRFSADLAYAATGIGLDNAPLARALGDSLSGEIRFLRENDGPFQITRLTLQGPGIEADVQGTIAGPADGFETRSSIALTADDAARFDALTGLDLGGAAEVLLVSTIRPLDGIFDLILTGQTTDLTLGISALDPLLRGQGAVEVIANRDTTGTRITDFSVRTPALFAVGAADLTSGASTATFDLTVTDIGAALPGLSGAATLIGKAYRDPNGAIAADLDATLPGGQTVISVSRPPALENAPFSVEIFAALPDLADFSDLTGRPLAGSMNVGMTGTIASDPALIDLTITGTTQDLGLGIAQLDPLLAGPGTIVGQIAGTGLNELSLDSLSVSTTALTATGAVQLSDGAISSTVDLRVRDAAVSMPGLTGPVEVSGSAYRAADGALLADLNGSVMGAVMIVTLSQPAGAPINAEVFADLRDLNRFSALAGRPLGGGATVGLTGILAADLGTIDLTLSGQSRDLELGFAPLDPLFAGEGTFEGRLARTGPTQFRVEGLALRTAVLTAIGSASFNDGVGQAGAEIKLAQIGLIAPGLDGPAQLQGTAVMRADRAITVQATATGPQTTGSFTASLAAGAADYVAELAVNIDDLSPYSTLIGQPVSGGLNARITGTVGARTNQFDLTLAAQTRNIDPGDATAALLLRGAGSVNGRFLRGDQGGLRVEGLQVRFPNLTVSGGLDGRGGAGNASFEARLTDIGLFTPEFSGPVTVTGMSQRDAAGNWQVNTQADGPGGTNAVILGQIGGNGTLNLTASGYAPLGLVNGILEPRRISGAANFDLALRGRPALNSLSGTLRLSDARLTDPVLSKAVGGITGTVSLSGGRAIVDLSGGLEGGGGLRLSGPVSITAPFAADLTVGLDQLVLRDPTLYETTASGTISVTGPLAGGAVIAGMIDLGATEVQVPSSGVSALGDLPVVRHINTPADVQLTLARAGLTDQGGAAGAGNAGPVYPLNLTIQAPARVFIRGRGLDAELGGQVVLGGTTRAVIPSGQFNLVRGRLEVLQQRFDLTEGSATLEGDFIPVIRLVARTTARTGTVISIIMDGPISEPTVSFTSAPELPQDEVLAQLIFGRDLSAISPLQAVQLAAAVGTLAGRGGGGLIEGFRTGLGVDDFDITSDAAGNTALRVGTYLTENVYTDVTISAGTTAVNLNLDLTEDLTVKGSVSSDGDTGLGIFFERDY